MVSGDDPRGGMVIRRDDSVATVLWHDESLIDVFVGLSPALDWLRDATMRKVMSRLVTVERAARLAGIDGDELVRRLNGVARAVDPAGVEPKARRSSAALESREVGLEVDQGVVVLDVRDLEPPEPMARTLAALEELAPGGTLVQINVRVPRFLLPRLHERGFTYEVREQAPDLVRVFIRRAAAG
jgi:tRNA 2-thiouridine synthesizing protein A